MNYREFTQRLVGTKIQRAEKVRAILGSTVELHGELYEVSSRWVTLRDATDPDQNDILVFLKEGTEGQFKQQLLSCSRYDEVRLLVEVGLLSSGDGENYSFFLISMKIVSTRAGREREKELLARAEAERRRQEEERWQLAKEHSDLVAMYVTRAVCLVLLILLIWGLLKLFVAVKLFRAWLWG